MLQIERMEAEHLAAIQEKERRKDNHPPTRNQLQEQLKTALYV